MPELAPPHRLTRVLPRWAAGRSQATEPDTGMRWITDLGEDAMAVIHTEPGNVSADMTIWSGNAELDFTYSDRRHGAASRPDRDRLLAGAIAMARDGLAALADPAAAAFPKGISYVSPSHPCRLIRASTLARYAAGATGQQQSASGVPGNRTCDWFPDDGALFLTVSVSPSIDDAQSEYQLDLQVAHRFPLTKATGSQPVKGLGTQATAIFNTGPAGDPGVELYVWSGNAVIQMSFTGNSILGPAPGRAVMLAADIAMARDALASLKRA